jgi:hypothetical protein
MRWWPGIQCWGGEGVVSGEGEYVRDRAVSGEAEFEVATGGAGVGGEFEDQADAGAGQVVGVV